jgi:hypothetical protein
MSAEGAALSKYKHRDFEGVTVLCCVVPSALICSSTFIPALRPGLATAGPSDLITSLRQPLQSCPAEGRFFGAQVPGGSGEPPHIDASDRSGYVRTE